MWVSGRSRKAPTDHTCPFPPPYGLLVGDLNARYSRLHHWLPAPLWVPTFAGTRFRASDRYCEAPYQDRALWHITQTAYICRCLQLLAGSELRRTPLARSSQNSPSETVWKVLKHGRAASS